MNKLFALAFLLLSINLSAQDWLTHYEKSNYLETPRYDQTIDYCQRLSDFSQQINITSLGKSPQGRDIMMLIMDKDGLTDPELIRQKGRIIVLVEACIHPGEPDGKDAVLMLMRDMAVNKKNTKVLDKVSLLFIPIFNVDGHERFGPYNRINQNGPTEMGWRTTANNLNLNRDFLKAEALEMQHWLKMYTHWLPEFFIDIHTTDGADYQYELTYDIEKYGFLDSGLTRWLKDIYEPRLISGMNEDGYKVFPYVQFKRWHDPRSGLRKGAAPPLVSQGYAAAQNRPGVLVETHMLKNYKTRVSSSYHMVKRTLAILEHQSGTLKTLVSMADNSTAADNFRKDPLPVAFRNVNTDSTMVDFEGFDYTVKKSDLTGGEWFIYDSTKPVTMKLPFYDKNVPAVTVNLPSAYIIPVEWTEVIEKLEFHGIKTNKLTKEVKIPVTSIHFSEFQFRQTPNEGRHMVNTKALEKNEERVFPAGSVVVPTNQRSARVIAFLLEPTASGSLVEWGFFNSVFEQKEYSETYVMETMAREMMGKDPQLKKEFEDTIKNNPAYSNNQMEMLNWFYSKSPYWDFNYKVYPIGKITDKNVLNNFNTSMK